MFPCHNDQTYTNDIPFAAQLLIFSQATFIKLSKSSMVILQVNWRIKQFKSTLYIEKEVQAYIIKTKFTCIVGDF